MDITFGTINGLNIEFTTSGLSIGTGNLRGACNPVSAIFALVLIFAMITVTAVDVLVWEKRNGMRADASALRFFPGNERPVRATKGDRLDVERFMGSATLDKG